MNTSATKHLGLYNRVNRALLGAFGCAACCVAVAALMSISLPAFAGDTLLLKSGVVKTTPLPTEVPDASKWSEQVGTTGPAYFIVQFKTKISTEDRQAINAAQARIVRYMPEDALIVFASGRQLARLQKQNQGIQSIMAYQPLWKMSSDLGPSSVFTAHVDSIAMIRLFPGEKTAPMVEKLRAIPDVKVISADGRSFVVRGTRPAFDLISAIEGVEWVQAYPQFELNHMALSDEQITDPPATASDYTDLTGYETGTKVMGFDAAWARGFTGRGQIASMADTGLDLGDAATIHGDFAGRIVNGFTFGIYAKTWEDPMGHGTHVAGSVMGSGFASGGILRGGAFEAGFIPEGMWSPIMENLTVPAKLADLFSKAYDAGARVHTNSWGAATNPGAYDSFAQQVDEFMASHPEMLILFAAGNSGVDAGKNGRIDANSIGSPGTAKNVLTVGASKNYVLKGGIQKQLKDLKTGPTSWGAEPLSSSMLSENPQGLAPFSSRGPTSDGRLKPEIVAPGTNILSVRSRHKDAETLWGAYNKDYVWSGGTSMATPLTAGAATVVRQYLVENRGIAHPSGALLKAALIHTATDLFPGQFGEVGRGRGQELLTHRPNNDEGYGRVDVAKATDLGKAVLIDENTGLSTGEVMSYPVQVSGGSKLVATMVYTDAAAAAGASKSLVNDLDLVVVDPAGVETSLHDSVNNSEMIEMPVTSGQYTVKVKGTNVPAGITNGKQPFALILSVY